MLRIKDEYFFVTKKKPIKVYYMSIDIVFIADVSECMCERDINGQIIYGKRERIERLQKMWHLSIIDSFVFDHIRIKLDESSRDTFILK